MNYLEHVSESLDELFARRKHHQFIVDAGDARFEHEFGCTVDYLMSNMHIVQSALNGHDAELRCSAISFIAHKYPAHASYNYLINVLRSDPSPSVRATAVHLLGLLFDHTGVRPITEILKDIARDSSEDNEVRKNAYLAVTWFNSKDELIDAEMFNFPEDAEWVFFDGVQSRHY